MVKPVMQVKMLRDLAAVPRQAYRVRLQLSGK
jgi:hypothetical protein